MTHDKEHLAENLQPLSDLPNYRIERGDPDPRGYTVVTGGRTIGRVEDLIIDTDAMKARYLLVERSDLAASGGAAQRVLIPIETVDVHEHDSQVVASRFTGTERVWSGEAHASRPAEERSRPAEERTRLTRAEEELRVGKREVSRGEARVGKRVETEHVSQPVTKRREEVIVERRPVEAGARGDASIASDEIRVPLMEEEVVVEKRPVIKEELVIGKRVVEERDTVEADLRREEFDIEGVTDVNPTGRGSRRER